MSEAPALLPDPLVDDGWLAVLDERSGRSRAVGEPVGHPRMGRGRGWRRPSGSCAGCPMGCPGPCTECVASLGPEPLLRAPAGLDRVGALVSYVGAGVRLVRSIKFANGRAPIEALGRAMAALAERSGSPPPDVVTWVPTTVARRGARGFDQAELLARAVARELGIGCSRVLLRAPGPAQSSLDARRRREGPRFRARPSASRLLLVDDVVTTGATLGAAAGVLRGKSAVSISAVVVAATPTCRPVDRATSGRAVEVVL